MIAPVLSPLLTRAREKGHLGTSPVLGARKSIWHGWLCRVAGKIRRMVGRTKDSWWRFGASKPGHRFQERYRRQQQSEHGWRDPRRLFFVVGGLAIAIASLVLGMLPGPGTLTFFVGLAMISGEFYPVARLLDWAEVRARKLGRWVGGVWGSSAVGKASVVVVGAICVAAVLYVAYRLLFGG